MTNDAPHRQSIPLLIAFLGAVLYVLMLWKASPHDIPGYWAAFFQVRAGQIEGITLGTFVYFTGVGLCVVAFSSLLPIRSTIVRRLLSIPGILSMGAGAVEVVAVLGCFIDKVS